MSSVFISYRRSDSHAFSKRMASALREHFAPNAIFFDQTTAVPGTRWPEEIEQALQAAKVMLVVIGSEWLRAADERDSRRRIDRADDWVRQEIVTALRRRENAERLEVIPVVIGDAPMPRVEDLDEDLGPLGHFQPLRLPDTGSEHDFDDLKDRLVRCRVPVRAFLLPATTPRYGRAPVQLTEEEEEVFLGEFEEWEIVETKELYAAGGFRRELHRVYEFPSFDPAFEFMAEVVTRGIKPMNHHPRWENTFNRVELWLTTFNLNYKPSMRDVRLARVCETVWEEFHSP